VHTVDLGASVSLCDRPIMNDMVSRGSSRVKETSMCDEGNCWNSPTLVTGVWLDQFKSGGVSPSRTSFWGEIRIPHGWSNDSWYGP
jgi:hypothetical protein